MKTLIIIGLIFLSGCASAGMNSSCGRITGNQITIPYVGGKADGNVYACHIGCFGMNCPKPDYGSLTTLTSEYIKSTSSSLTTTVPMTVTLSPSK